MLEILSQVKVETCHSIAFYDRKCDLLFIKVIIVILML